VSLYEAEGLSSQDQAGTWKTNRENFLATEAFFSFCLGSQTNS